MVDSVVSPETMASTNEQLEKQNSLLGIGLDYLNSLKSKFSEAGEEVSKITGQLETSISHMRDFGHVSTEASGSLAETIIKADMLSVNIIRASDAFKGFGAIGTNMTNTVDNQFKKITERVEKIKAVLAEARADRDTKIGFKQDDNQWAAFSALNPVLKGMQDGLLKLSSHIGKISKNTAELAGENQKALNGFLGLLTASGNYGKVTDLTGSSIDSLRTRSEQFANNLGEIAKETGLTTEQIADLAGKMSVLPDIFDKVNVSAGEQKASYDALTAVTQIAAGAHVKDDVVVRSLSESYDKLGTSTQAGLEGFALMSEASKRLDLRFNDTQQYMTQSVSLFSKMGVAASDKTKIFEGLTSVLGRYSDSLRETGLSAKASTDMIAGMVSAVGSLNVGTKAFLSTRSGGPGGLQGAFQIDKLLKEGKIEQVMAMAEKSLKSQLGKIVSLDDASKSQGAAAQYQKQMMLVQSGAFGSLVKPGDDQGAQRLLEALAKGGPNRAAGMSGQESLKTVMGAGQEIQKDQTTILSSIDTTLTQLQIDASSIAATFVKDVGTSRGTGETAKFMQDLNKDSHQKSSNFNVYHPPTPSDSKGIAANHGAEHFANLGRAGAAAGIDLFGGVSKGVSALKETAAQAYEAGAPTVSSGLNHMRDVASKVVHGPRDNVQRTTQQVVGHGAAQTAQHNFQQSQNNGPMAVTVTGEITGLCASCGREFSQHLHPKENSQAATAMVGQSTR